MVGACVGACVGMCVGVGVGVGHATLNSGLTSAQHRTPKGLDTASHLGAVEDLVDPGATMWPPIHASSAHTSAKSKLHPLCLAMSPSNSVMEHNRAPLLSQ